METASIRADYGAERRGSILYFSNHLRGPKASAGARTWHQTKRLSDEFNITVVIPAVDPVTAQPVTEETFSGLDMEVVRVERIATLENDRSSLSRRAKYFLSAMRGAITVGIRHSRVDIVMSMGLPITLLLVAWLSALRHRAKFVVDVRDMPFETALELGYLKSRWLISLARAAETFLLRRADSILTNSPRYKPALVKRGLDGDKITVAYIGYDNFGEPPALEVDEWREGLLARLDPATEFIGVYAGTIGHAFPVETILEGADLLRKDRRIGFVFLGDGQRLQQFTEFADHHELNTAFLGRVTKGDVSRICRAADCCIYPANRGEFSGAILGNKVFDYLGARRPVLYIGGDSAVRDLLEEVGAGLYSTPDDPSSFVNNVRELAADSELRDKLGAAAASAIEQGGYTARASADVLLELLHRLAAPPH